MIGIKDQEELLTTRVSEDEEFEQILESPDLNVQLDMDTDESEEVRPTRKKEKKAELDVEDPDAFDDEDD